jgi:hypothetical protein
MNISVGIKIRITLKIKITHVFLFIISPKSDDTLPKAVVDLGNSRKLSPTGDEYPLNITH